MNSEETSFKKYNSKFFLLKLYKKNTFENLI